MTHLRAAVQWLQDWVKHTNTKVVHLPGVAQVVDSTQHHPCDEIDANLEEAIAQFGGGFVEPAPTGSQSML